jgi:hypothetical protein
LFLFHYLSINFFKADKDSLLVQAEEKELFKKADKLRENPRNAIKILATVQTFIHTLSHFTEETVQSLMTNGN